MPKELANIFGSPRSTIIGTAAGAALIGENGFNPENWLDWVRIVLGVASMIFGAINRDNQK